MLDLLKAKNLYKLAFLLYCLTAVGCFESKNQNRISFNGQAEESNQTFDQDIGPDEEFYFPRSNQFPERPRNTEVQRPESEIDQNTTANPSGEDEPAPAPQEDSANVKDTAPTTETPDSTEDILVDSQPTASDEVQAETPPEEDFETNSDPTQSESDNDTNSYVEVNNTDEVSLPRDLLFELEMLAPQVKDYVDQFEELYASYKSKSLDSVISASTNLLHQSWSILASIELARLKLQRDLGKWKDSVDTFHRIDKLANDIKQKEPIHRYMIVQLVNKISDKQQRKERIISIFADINKEVAELEEQTQDNQALYQRLAQNNLASLQQSSDPKKSLSTWSDLSNKASVQKHYRDHFVFQQLVFFRTYVYELGEIKIGKNRFRSFKKVPISRSALTQRIFDVNRQITQDSSTPDALIEKGSELVNQQAEFGGFDRPYANNGKTPFNSNWVDILTNSINSPSSTLLSAIPVDFNMFCPAMTQLNSSQRMEYWIQIYSKMIYLESFFKPGVSYDEESEYKRQAVISRGLLQLSGGSALDYGCKGINKYKDLHNNKVNLECGEDIGSNRFRKARHTVMRFNTYVYALDKNGKKKLHPNGRPKVAKDWYGYASYWAVFRTKKVLRIMEHMSKTPECHRYVKPVPFS